MNLPLVLLLIIVGAGLLIFGLTRLLGGNKAQISPPPAPPAPSSSPSDSGCCGLHAVCAKARLREALATDIVYYDDEELDAYAGLPAECYTPAQTEQFRQVLLTMQVSDVAGWLRSLQLRHIHLPAQLRDELMLVVSNECRRRNLS